MTSKVSQAEVLPIVFGGITRITNFLYAIFVGLVSATQWVSQCILDFVITPILTENFILLTI